MLFDEMIFGSKNKTNNYITFRFADFDLKKHFLKPSTTLSQDTMSISLSFAGKSFSCCHTQCLLHTFREEG